jgi:flagellar biogenesis protein FliO
MATRLIIACFALTVLSAAVLPAQEGSATGELVRSGDVPYVESNALRRSPPAELPQAHLSDDPEPVAAEPETFSLSSEPETFSLSSDEEETPQPLKKNSPPRKLATRDSSSKKASKSVAMLSNPTESLITMGWSLCVVLTLFFGLAWLTRRGLPKGMGKLPGEVIEVLGKAPLVKGQELQLIRVGSRLVLICVTPHGAETLTEIVERTEVDRISAICRSNSPASMTAAFNQVLTGVGREPASGFAGNSRTSSERRGGRGYA